MSITIEGPMVVTGVEFTGDNHERVRVRFQDPDDPTDEAVFVMPTDAVTQRFSLGERYTVTITSKTG